MAKKKTSKKTPSPLLYSSSILAGLIILHIYSVLLMAGARYQDAVVWIKEPLNGILSVALLAAIFWQILIESTHLLDKHPNKTFWLTQVKRGGALLWGLSTIAVLRFYLFS